jgi:hypothetical protein
VDGYWYDVITSCMLLWHIHGTDIHAGATPRGGGGMRTAWTFSRQQLVLLSVVALLLGAELLILCWVVVEGRSLWAPVLGTVTLLWNSRALIATARRRHAPPQH